MKKIFAFLMLALVMAGCTKDWEEDQRDPKNPTAVPAPMLFANAQRNLVDQMVTPNVNSGIFRLISQHWANTTYPEESRYDLVSRNIPQNFWFTLYRDVLMDFREASKIIEADQALNATVKANQLAITEVMEVYTWSVLVNTFGDIPYSEALNPDIIYPKYDDDAAIYADLFTRLDAAITTLTAGTGSGSFGGSDLIYGGNVGRWLKFANSLKLKLGMTVADVNPDRARTAVSQAVAAGVFTANEDQAIFKYTATTPNVNPVWSNLVQSGRNDFVPAATLVDRMNALNDPRRAIYFTQHNGAYVGGIYGNNNTYANFSKVNPALTTPDRPALLLGYDEVEFYLAEAAARGFITGSPAEHFRKAITANMTYWGVPAADITAYFTRPEVATDLAALAAPGAGGTLTEAQRRALGVQKWIALYERPFHAWTEFRRLDYPQLQAPAAEYRPVYNTVPVRYPYPPTERTLNQDNVNAASTAIGGDDATTRIFWDVR